MQAIAFAVQDTGPATDYSRFYAAVAEAKPCKPVSTVVNGTVEPDGSNTAPMTARWLRGTLTAQFSVTGTVGDGRT